MRLGIRRLNTIRLMESVERSRFKVGQILIVWEVVSFSEYIDSPCNCRNVESRGVATSISHIPEIPRRRRNGGK